MSHKILILGVTGMLGHTLFTRLAPHFEVYGTLRQPEKNYPPAHLMPRVISGVDAMQPDTVARAIEALRPDVIINCIGIIKQLKEAKDPLISIGINSLFPHQVAKMAAGVGARLIHISTDCVFDGLKGRYTEEDESNARDLYGRSKFLGEVKEYEHCITLRTSIIGHELKGKFGLIEWFLAQSGQVKGFTRAIYTGFPTIEMARIITDYVLPNPQLHGLYHVASQAIDKYSLLQLVARQYGKKISIVPDDAFFCDRSMLAARFNAATGYSAPGWEELLANMHSDYLAAL